VVDGRKDSLEDLGTHVKSRAWMNRLNSVYNKMTSGRWKQRKKNV